MSALRHLAKASGFSITAVVGAAFSLLLAGGLSDASGQTSRAETEAKRAASSSPALAPGAYFGLKLPGETPELFAPAFVSIPGRSVGHLAFSPDATECAFTVFESNYAHNRILFTRFEKGAWTPPAPEPAFDGHESLEPLFSRDNRQLYFAVKSPGNSPNVDFWVAPRTAQGWGKPQPLSAPLNSPQNEFSLAQTADGTMYFASRRDGGRGGLDLYRAVVRPGEPPQVENLGSPVNSAVDDGDPALSPDGRVLVFYSASQRPRASGDSDLFVCFDNGKGGWTHPVHLGAGFNTPAAEYAATFSHDGRVLFFARFDGRKGEVHWVSTAALERFRPQSEAGGGRQEPPVESPPEKKAVPVAPEILRRYAGSYVMAAQPGFTNEITLEADQLWTQVPGQPKVPMFAESETRFFLKVAEVGIEFVKNERGDVTGLVIHQNGMEFSMTRQAPPGDGAR